MTNPSGREASSGCEWLHLCAYVLGGGARGGGGASLSWTCVPQTQGKAVCEFVFLVQDFAPVAKDFQENKWVRFTPHYLVWVCPDSYSKSSECKSQCIRQGRYCTPDPDGDLAKGYSGRDIVQV